MSIQEEQLVSCEREKRRVTQQLIRRERELTQAEETIRRDQQVIQEMRNWVSRLFVINCSYQSVGRRSM